MNSRTGTAYYAVGRSTCLAQFQSLLSGTIPRIAASKPKSPEFASLPPRGLPSLQEENSSTNRRIISRNPQIHAAYRPRMRTTESGTTLVASGANMIGITQRLRVRPKLLFTLSSTPSKEGQE